MCPIEFFLFTPYILLSIGCLALQVYGRDDHQRRHPQSGQFRGAGRQRKHHVRGATLQCTSSNRRDNSAPIADSTGPIAIDTNGMNITFHSGLVSSNTGGFDKIGGGELTLAAANTFSGNTLVGGGTLALSSHGSCASLAVDRVDVLQLGRAAVVANTQT